MASPTRWTGVWVNSGSWWWTGRSGVLQSMGSQRVEHDWVTELNWTDNLRFWVLALFATDLWHLIYVILNQFLFLWTLVYLFIKWRDWKCFLLCHSVLWNLIFMYKNCTSHLEGANLLFFYTIEICLLPEYPVLKNSSTTEGWRWCSEGIVFCLVWNLLLDKKNKWILFKLYPDLISLGYSLPFRACFKNILSQFVGS